MASQFTLVLPSHFLLPDITAVTAPAFELKYNPYQRSAKEISEKWFKSYALYDEKKEARFLGAQFHALPGMAFPDADIEHLSTCLNHCYWAFAFDDLSDEGDHQCKPDQHKIGVDLVLDIFRDECVESPEYPYAAMMWSIWQRVKATASPGTCARLARSTEQWCAAQIQQSTNRAVKTMPSVSDFILMRRHTVGYKIVEAMIEYSLDIDLPDSVVEHPVMNAIHDATNDIATWPNDLCSFNKEQADGDDQNIVFCVMAERKTDLQDAIYIVISMIAERVEDYRRLKTQLPSFGKDLDKELLRYLKGLENFVQGTVVWSYSPRYFRDIDISERDNLVIPVFERKQPIEGGLELSSHATSGK